MTASPSELLRVYDGAMRFATPLVPARLTRRYKRFLADMTLDTDGREITAHCANPGSMMGLADPGTRCWIEPNDDPRKKLKFGWRLVEHGDGHFTGVDTGIPNRVVRQALEDHRIDALEGYDTVRPEVRFGTGSRVDFLLGGGATDIHVEVKSVTLSRRNGIAEFPDSVTARGARHLDDLAQVVRDGGRSVLLFLVQRTDAAAVTLADDIDPAYAATFARARKIGVEVLCIGTRISPLGIEIGDPLPFHSPAPI